MSKGEALRALVSERMAAAAEDILMLFESTMAEYEEELRFLKEENHRNQQLLELIHNQIPSTRPGPGLSLGVAETPGIKAELEEPSLKQEEEPLPVFVSDSSAVCVKTEESSLLQQTQTGDMVGEDASSEPHLHAGRPTEPDTDFSDNWRAPFSLSAAQMQTEADGDMSTDLFLQTRSTSETFVHRRRPSGAGGKRHPCPFCSRRFGTKPNLQLHIRIHTGEKPFSCSFCDKSFSQKSNLDTHTRTHTGEKPYHCDICTKSFAHKGNLDVHRRRHTGEKPFSCSFCKKCFANSSSLAAHRQTHSGEKLYGCSFCKKTYVRKDHFDQHMRTHSGEKPFSCNVCAKTFACKKALDTHFRMHTRVDHTAVHVG